MSDFDEFWSKSSRRMTDFNEPQAKWLWNKAQEAQGERIRELKAGLREMLKAEWMVTCDWADPSKRADLLDRMEKLLETPQ